MTIALQVVCTNCGNRDEVPLDRLSKFMAAKTVCTKCGISAFDLYDAPGLTSDPFPPAQLLHPINEFVQQVKCSNCFTEFNVTATDPVQPLPPCPNCGSQAVSAAGATLKTPEGPRKRQTASKTAATKWTKEKVREWLLGYAWLGTPEERAAEVDCILSQDDWKHLDAQMEHARGMASGEEADLEKEVTDYTLSALYETHDAPHLPTCPRNKKASKTAAGPATPASWEKSLTAGQNCPWCEFNEVAEPGKLIEKDGLFECPKCAMRFRNEGGSWTEASLEASTQKTALDGGIWCEKEDRWIHDDIPNHQKECVGPHSIMRQHGVRQKTGSIRPSKPESTQYSGHWEMGPFDSQEDAVAFVKDYEGRGHYMGWKVIEVTNPEWIKTVYEQEQTSPTFFVVRGDASDYLRTGEEFPAGKVVYDGKKRASKAAEIAKGILATNPGIDPKEARKVARKTIHRYPKVAAQDDQ